MRLYDARTGEVATVQPERRLLLLAVAGLDPSGPRLADLRALLTADVIRRLAEMRRLVVRLAWLSDSGRGEPGAGDAVRAGAAYGADCMALGLRPPAEEHPVPAGPDIQVGGSAANGSLWVRPGDARLDESGRPGPRLADLGLADPLALRLALLDLPYREPAVLSAAALDEAGRTLAGLRRQVADWATQPSQRMSAAYEERVTGALAEDLDGRTALAALADLAAAGDVAPGAKFETAAHLDQLLGLDLTREVGR